MNKIKKIIISGAGFILTAVLLCGCTEADRVTYNVQKEADNFNVTRRLSVINARSDKPVLELIGNFSISNNEANELVVTIEACSRSGAEGRAQARREARRKQADGR